jgi:addiction module HigA family antidote
VLAHAQTQSPPPFVKNLILRLFFAKVNPSFAASPHGIAEELTALNMSAAALARRLKAPTNRIIWNLNGQRAIAGDTALRLAHFFGTSAQFWLNLQSLYDLRLAERKAGKAIKALPTLKRAKGRTAPHAEQHGNL